MQPRRLFEAARHSPLLARAISQWTDGYYPTLEAMLIELVLVLDALRQGQPPPTRSFDDYRKEKEEVRHEERQRCRDEARKFEVLGGPPRYTKEERDHILAQALADFPGPFSPLTATSPPAKVTEADRERILAGEKLEQDLAFGFGNDPAAVPQCPTCTGCGLRSREAVEHDGLCPDCRRDRRAGMALPLEAAAAPVPTGIKVMVPWTPAVGDLPPPGCQYDWADPDGDKPNWAWWEDENGNQPILHAHTAEPLPFKFQIPLPPEYDVVITNAESLDTARRIYTEILSDFTRLPTVNRAYAAFLQERINASSIPQPDQEL